MRNPGQSIFRLFAGIVACANLSVFDSLAQTYPVKPIRMVVGFSPGGLSDVLARLVSHALPDAAKRARWVQVMHVADDPVPCSPHRAEPRCVVPRNDHTCREQRRQKRRETLPACRGPAARH